MKYTYHFGNKKADGSKDDKKLLGGKGSNLAEMTKIGLPVPPGFTISTEGCSEYHVDKEKFLGNLESEVKESIVYLENMLDKKFGGENPLLVSVRSGAAVSMPGMMDTVLNLGLNDVTVEYLGNKSGDMRFSYDSYRRFLQMFGNVVLGINSDKFENVLELEKKFIGKENDTDLMLENLKNIVEKYKVIIKNESGEDFPQDPFAQLTLSIDAVFASWNNDRAIYYRKMHNIPGEIGTAVNVQAMVYGNLGETSGTGVAFTRNPATGEKLLFGEYLRNAQGEDVVAGIRTPSIISQEQNLESTDSMEKEWKDIYSQFLEMANTLEGHYKDMQDIEFTIEEGKLFLLQTRTGKRSAKAMVKIAMDFHREGEITKEEILNRIDTEKIDELLHPVVAPNQNLLVVAKGLNASPGVASGFIVFSNEEAERFVSEKKAVILVRNETSPEDIVGMNISEGILTARGGMTSHAAVVARSIGTPCVCGCTALEIDSKTKIMVVKNSKLSSKTHIFKTGDWITINGNTGEVIEGKVKTIPPTFDADFLEVLTIADSVRRLGIRANADTPKDAKKAIEFGAEGIGLCRTEHMFFEEDRINIMREMILSHTREERKKALSKLKEMQKKDFLGIFKAMNGLPVTIRFLDPPLHEFLPERQLDIRIVALQMGRTEQEIREKIMELSESNPMLGLRGCRVGILFPEVIEMQCYALFGAALEMKKQNLPVSPELMVPLVSHVNEFKHQKDIVMKIYKKVFKDQKLDFLVGTMIELPRAALTADEIAKVADFFSFGTNDLTQTTYGLSRDDANKFLNLYEEEGFIENNPFVVLDRDGVGQLVKMATEKGRENNSSIKIGLCGEHGGNPSSIEFLETLGLDYVSCSPYRLPVARISAAKAVIM